MISDKLFFVYSSPLFASITIFNNLFLFYLHLTIFYLRSHNFNLAPYRTLWIIASGMRRDVFFHLYQPRALKSPR